MLTSGEHETSEGELENILERLLDTLPAILTRFDGFAFVNMRILDHCQLDLRSVETGVSYYFVNWWIEFESLT